MDPTFSNIWSNPVTANEEAYRKRSESVGSVSQSPQSSMLLSGQEPQESPLKPQSRPLRLVTQFTNASPHACVSAYPTQSNSPFLLRRDEHRYIPTAFTPPPRSPPLRMDNSFPPTPFGASPKLDSTHLSNAVNQLAQQTRSISFSRDKEAEFELPNSPRRSLKSPVNPPPSSCPWPTRIQRSSSIRQVIFPQDPSPVEFEFANSLLVPTSNPGPVSTTTKSVPNLEVPKSEKGKIPDTVDIELLKDIPAWLRSLRLHKYTPIFCPNEQKAHARSHGQAVELMNMSDQAVQESIVDCMNGKQVWTWREMIALNDEQLEIIGVAALGARRKMLKVFELVNDFLNDL